MVGQNLLGEAAFDAVVVPPNPIQPTDPCRKFVQPALSGGELALAVDSDAAPANFIPEIQFKSLGAFAPMGIDRCLVGSVDAS
jgi:hypothetical protein